MSFLPPKWLGMVSLYHQKWWLWDGCKWHCFNPLLDHLSPRFCHFDPGPPVISGATGWPHRGPHRSHVVGAESQQTGATLRSCHRPGADSAPWCFKKTMEPLIAWRLGPGSVPCTKNCSWYLTCIQKQMSRVVHICKNLCGENFRCEHFNLLL